ETLAQRAFRCKAPSHAVGKTVWHASVATPPRRAQSLRTVGLSGLPGPLRSLGALGRIVDHAAGAMRGRASRRAWVGHGRAHIEVRGLQRPGSEDLAASLKRALERVRSVRWAESNAG